MTDDKKRIALIEDDRFVIENLKRILGKNGYGVDPYPNGRSAVDGIRNQVPEAIIADYDLGDITGVEVVRALGESVKYIPKISITGYPSTKFIKSAKECFDYVLIKPVSPIVLLDCLKESLNKYRNGNITIPKLSREL